MKSWPTRALLLAGAATLILAIPASGQDRDDPESLLPPGFGDPETLPPPENKAQPAPQQVDEMEGDELTHAIAGRGAARPLSRGLDPRMTTNRGEDGEAPAHKPATAEPKVGRNDPCPCGSGKKYKKCHGVGVV